MRRKSFSHSAVLTITEPPAARRAVSGMDQPDTGRRAQPWALGIGIAGAALMLAAAAAAAKRRRPPADRAPPPRAGDEAAPGTPQTGEGLCPECSGKGVVDGRACETCAGTGTVVVNIGDA